MAMVFHWPTPQIDNIDPMQHIPTMRYAIVIEKTATSFSAYLPDLPGCIATDRDQAEGEMKNAIQFHVDGLMEDRLPAPQATRIVGYLETTQLNNFKLKPHYAQK